MALRASSSIVGPLGRGSLVDGELVDNRYRVEREIGRGGMGVVYLAHDINLGRRLALKLIAPGLSSSAQVVASFRREARVLAGLRSPHVVLLHAFGEHRGSLFFVMEHVEGTTLASDIDAHVAEQRPVSLPRAMSLLREIARGLDAVHAAGTVHRDVKPDNVMLERGTERCVLLDFGLAALVDGSGTLAGATPEYAAPEQSHGAGVSARSDGYAFAVMAFELLSGGKLPFEAQSAVEYYRKHAMEAPRLISSVRPRLASIDGVFARALAKRPEYRFSSCSDFVQALEAKIEVGPPTWSVPSRRPGGDADNRLHALVVEADGAAARNLSRAAAIALHGMHAELHLARRAEDALDAVRSVRPQLIVVGWDSVASATLEQLVRARDAATQVLAVSSTVPAWVDPTGARQAPIRWLRKPYLSADLLKALETMARDAGGKAAAVPKRVSSGDFPAPSVPGRIVGK